MATESGLVRSDLVPFRIFTKVERTPSGEFVGRWKSWFRGMHGSLQAFTGREKITDWLMIGNEDRGDAILIRLNAAEEKAYAQRIAGSKTRSLLSQLQSWEDLKERSPMTTERLGLSLEYAPIVLISKEIQKQIFRRSAPPLRRNPKRVPIGEGDSLVDAKKEIRKRMEAKKHQGKDRVVICREYLSTHHIIGKPDYTPEKLNNLVAKQIEKERNAKPALK